jgi:hypothetical protein
MASTVVVLPDPDSPTRPMVSPRRKSNDTPSTARSGPPGESNSTTRSRTDSRGASASARGRSTASGSAAEPGSLRRGNGFERSRSRWWRLRRGLSTSSSAVPSSVVPSTTQTMASPGGISAHHAPADMALRPNAKFSICPQLIRVGSPRPMKASVDSSRMAREMTNTMLASISGSTWGST